MVDHILILIAALLCVLTIVLRWRFADFNFKSRVRGWTSPGDTGQVPHESGFGTRESLVLRLPRDVFGWGLLAIVFFGGGGLFSFSTSGGFWPPGTVKESIALLGMTLFPIAGVFMIWNGFTRIIVTDVDIRKKHLFRALQTFPMYTLAEVSCAGKPRGYGIVLKFSDGRRLRIMASFIGYGDLIARLAKINDVAREMNATLAPQFSK